MTTHIVCLDGTNQTLTQEFPTNIARIFQILSGETLEADWGSFEKKHEDSYGKYLPGIGSRGSPTLRILGRLFGDGIAEPIVRGYTYLSRAYTVGDEIIIVGFSRGATAARALAGFVVVHGLLDNSKYNVDDKNLAYQRAISSWYSYRQDNSALANQKRLDLIQARLGTAIPILGPEDYTKTDRILGVGVFDTVSSLGIPHLDTHGDAVYDFALCDTTLNDKVIHGFHALAADEMRDLFRPTFWAERKDIVQEIFPGAHSNVGGGSYREQGLADGALDWMLSHLETIGLHCDRQNLKPAIQINYLDIAHDEALTFPYMLTPRRARAFPRCAKPSEALLKRLGKMTELLPGDERVNYTPKGRYADGSLLFRLS